MEIVFGGFSLLIAACLVLFYVMDKREGKEENL